MCNYFFFKSVHECKMSSDCDSYTIKFYHDVLNNTWAELWRIFSNCGRLEVNVAGLSWLTAHAEP